MFFFLPTLSSLNFTFLENGRKVQFVEFHEEEKPFMRKPLSKMLQSLLMPSDPKKEKTFIDFEQTFKDDVSSTTESDGEIDRPKIKESLSPGSWFSILWTCQKQVLVDPKFDDDMPTHNI